MDVKGSNRSSCTSSLTLIKAAILLVSLMFCWSLAYGIYYMVTYHTRKHCYICDETDGDFSRYAPFFWYSSWALNTSTITWFAFAWKFIKVKTAGTSSESSRDHSLILIELSLPLSMFAMIGFTIYLATSSWGADLINQEECHRLVDATTPKDDGSEELSASSKMNLVAQIIVNLCIHYVCPIANTALYFAYHTRKAPWNPARPVGFILILSVVVVIAQEVGGLVIYCTNSIYLTALYAILFVTACHALFFFQREGKCNDPRDTLDLDEEEAEVETTSSTETLA
mmetsp:Transcript_11080/g.17138  ORF Transcript_11080/g.17138 Transcript_11080/m.17138 type:complete len:284 (+) Transcript_11080:923-1774(+)